MVLQVQQAIERSAEHALPAGGDHPIGADEPIDEQTRELTLLSFGGREVVFDAQHGDGNRRVGAAGPLEGALLATGDRPALADETKLGPVDRRAVASAKHDGEKDADLQIAQRHVVFPREPRVRRQHLALDRSNVGWLALPNRAEIIGQRDGIDSVRRKLYADARVDLQLVDAPDEQHDDERTPGDCSGHHPQVGQLACPS